MRVGGEGMGWGEFFKIFPKRVVSDFSHIKGWVGKKGRLF